MLPQEIIRNKRDNKPLKKEDIESFVNMVTSGNAGEGQIAAFCMATFLNGMTMDERTALTMAMASSGTVLDWSGYDLDGPVLDKHSTGGVGDKVSLMLAPIIAACGGYVPMISGRGLGHTGGTLDKMDSIPGYISQPELETLQAVVKNSGCAIVGATHDVAPADKAMYAVRDITGTVESIDLITASILSKKLAAGLQGLVMDVKFGSGAFMENFKDAKALASSIVSVAHSAGLPCTALMTDMNEVLGRTAGNAIEVREAIEYLRGGERDPRLHEVVMALASELLVTGKIANTPEEGRIMAQKHLDDGRAAHFFERMVMHLGGPSDIIEKYEKRLPLATHGMDIHAGQDGVVETINVRQIGLAIIALGGGRIQVADRIDHSVGLSSIAAIGEEVGPNRRPLCTIWGRREDDIKQAAQMIKNAYHIAPQGKNIEKGELIRERIAA